jgi:hypothetical protein
MYTASDMAVTVRDDRQTVGEAGDGSPREDTPMQAPHTHGGFVTIDSDENIVMHDRMEDACVYAGLRDGCHVYEAQFMPMFDMTEVRQRYHEGLVQDLVGGG